MKIILAYYILTFITITFIGCGTDNRNRNETVSDSTTAAITVNIDSLLGDTVLLRETFNQEDLPVNEYLTDRLRPIRANFRRINSITKWTSIDTVELSESTEGGEAKFYFQKGQLEKIVTRNYGETFQQLTEYYLLKGQLSFVFEKRHIYNRPIYYDTTEMKENADTEIFDFGKSEIIEDRSYFENGKLLHQLNNQDCGSPFSNHYLLEEQKRIKANFDRLIGQTKSKQRPKR